MKLVGHSTMLYTPDGYYLEYDESIKDSWFSEVEGGTERTIILWDIDGATVINNGCGDTYPLSDRIGIHESRLLYKLTLEEYYKHVLMEVI